MQARAWGVAIDWGSGAWEVAGILGQTGVASEVRAGLRILSWLSRGRPVLMQAGFECCRDLGRGVWVG